MQITAVKAELAEIAARSATVHKFVIAAEKCISGDREAMSKMRTKESELDTKISSYRKKLESFNKATSRYDVLSSELKLPRLHLETSGQEGWRAELLKLESEDDQMSKQAQEAADALASSQLQWQGLMEEQRCLRGELASLASPLRAWEEAQSSLQERVELASGRLGSIREKLAAAYEKGRVLEEEIYSAKAARDATRSFGRGCECGC
eukprot:jgi/Mesvir1/9826/Mv19661-RA.1